MISQWEAIEETFYVPLPEISTPSAPSRVHVVKARVKSIGIPPAGRLRGGRCLSSPIWDCSLDSYDDRDISRAKLSLPRFNAQDLDGIFDKPVEGIKDLLRTC